MCRLIWRAPVGRGVGWAPLEGGQSHRQVFDEVDWYGVVAVYPRQEVGVWVSGYSAEIYASPVGRGGEGLLQAARTRVCAPRVAVGALALFGVRYRVYSEGSHHALYVVGDDGAEVCQSCRAAFAMVYPDWFLQCHLGAYFWGQRIHGAFVSGLGDAAGSSANA